VIAGARLGAVTAGVGNGNGKVDAPAFPSRAGAIAGSAFRTSCDGPALGRPPAVLGRAEAGVVDGAVGAALLVGVSRCVPRYQVATLVPPATATISATNTAAATPQPIRRRGGGLMITTGASRWPSRITIATASARLDAPSFVSALPTCQFTVLSAIESVAAIAFVVMPAATSRMTWVSRMLRSFTTY